MMKQRSPKGPHKIFILLQIGDMGLPGSAYPLNLDVLVRWRKTMFFDLPQNDPPKVKSTKDSTKGETSRSGYRSAGVQLVSMGARGVRKAEPLIKESED